MSELPQIPTDYKKLLDMTLYKYLPKKVSVRALFNTIQCDSSQVTLEYVRKTQTYAASKGWTSMDDPVELADGSSPPTDSIGTEDATSTPKSYAKAFRLDRKILNSGNELVKAYVAEHTVEMANIIENYVNRSLITNMASNAAQSYSASGGTWATTGDPVADINAAKSAFMLQSGGIDADFLLVNPNEYVDLSNDQRFQSTLYVNNKQLETGTISPKPLGLDVLRDPAVTTGSFFLGKKGMFGDLMVTENYKTFERDEGIKGKEMQAVFSYVDQYKLPYYLMYGTGI